jgi:pimeloyl-ACP methyl ester carboxylesterase
MNTPSLFSRRLLALLLVVTVSIANSSASTSDYLALGNDTIYYEDVGQGFPLVLVSGGSGMDLRQWDQITPALSEGFRVIRYDPRGIGKSDNPTVRYSDADDLVNLLDHLDLDRIGLIGLSSSGGFALEFAVQYPERLTGVVVAAPFVPGFEFSASMMERLNRMNQAAEKGREPFLDSMFNDPHFFPSPLHRSVRSPARENMGHNFDKGADFDASLPIALEPPLIEQLSTISTPVLLVAGELDHPDVLRRNKFIAATIPTTEEKIIGGAGHNSPQENPIAFLETITPFLESIETTSFPPAP